MHLLLKKTLASNNRVIKDLRENRRLMKKVLKALDRNKAKKKK